MVTFLAGVLLAAVLALAETRLVIERKVLERYKILLAEARDAAGIDRNRAAAAMARAELLLNASLSPILYVDQDLKCLYHNRAAAQMLSLRADLVKKRPLRGMLGDEVYRKAYSHFEDALTGKPSECHLVVRDAAGRSTLFNARQLPHSTRNPDGFYLILDPVDPGMPAAEPSVATKKHTAEAKRRFGVASGEDLHIRNMINRLMPTAERLKEVRGLHENGFILLAQKIAGLKTSLPEPDCYEVLLRLKEEEEQLLPPGGFIDVAEHYGLMGEIDRWVVRTVVTHCLVHCARVPEWRIPMFSINVSHTAIADPEFALFVRAELGRPGMTARALCFEIDERVLIERNADVRNFVAAVRNKGCRVAIDGFGGNEVHFSLLHNLPVDFLKLNAYVIQNMLSSPSSMAQVRAIKSMCDQASIRTIALFVESEKHAKALSEIGIDYVQGFGIARPEPIENVVSASSERNLTRV